MNIYLIGFMGTGKSSVGRRLAELKGRGFIDLDELIELRQQSRICDIFARRGEAYFRKVEKKILKEAASQKNFVVACGGGAVLDPDNIKLMKKTGFLVCLSASVGDILKRTSGSAQRPILNVEDPRERIELLLKMRAPYYARADKTVDTSRLSVKQAALKVLRILPKGR